MAPDMRELIAMPGLSGVNRREQVRRQRAERRVAAMASPSVSPTTSPAAATRPAVVASGGLATQPASEQAATQPAGQQAAPVDGAAPLSGESRVAGETASGPVALDMQSIVQRVFDNSPVMRASREQMGAAEHALEEFRANLSRFEPYVEATGDSSSYPFRRGARGNTGEVVAGVQKETFEGAVLKLEGGASASRFTYSDVEDDEDPVDEGSGGVMRARLEVPFVGSRKRQERVISQAFQESQARKARLEYLGDFREYVVDALQYYLQALYYRDYAEVADRQARILEEIVNDDRVRAMDRFRLASSIESSRVTRDQYRVTQRTYTLLLLALLGLPMDTPVTLSEREEGASTYLERLSTPQGREALLAEAYENNPRFRVLADAIADAELQRKQAIIGRYDLTAFLEGTQFPFGAVTYDDRIEGWAVGGGINIRLNDNRVLTAARLKAEALIRQYEAEIETERLTIQRKIVDNSEKLQSYYKIREEAAEVARKKQTEFERRAEVYFEGNDPTLTIDDVLGSLSEWTSADYRLATNWYYIGLADLQVMTATGELYRMVGMDIEDVGGEKEPSTDWFSQ